VSAAAADKPVVAAFDFDGTLTRHDTLLPFLRYLLGDAKVLRHALAISPTLAGYGLGLIPNGVAKERVFMQCLTGMQLDTLRQEGERFAMLVLPGLLRGESLQRLAWHRRQGHRCVVISASLDLYVRPWAQRAGFNDIIATHLEVGADGRISGRLSGENCFGAEKVRRLEALLGERERYTLYAYGDSRGDRELMSIADHAYFRQMPAGETGA
jgi:phosphatidylglycerophosphatase C